MTTDKPIKYLIVEEAGEYVLYSEVETDFAGIARNYVASGSLERLHIIKEYLKVCSLNKHKHE
jgi:hypothetical protein